MADMSGVGGLTPGPGLPPQQEWMNRTQASATFAETSDKQQSVPDSSRTPKAVAPPETPLVGFNPSARIDPDTHIVVLTVKGADGKELLQMPSQHQLNAYKAEAATARKA